MNLLDCCNIKSYCKRRNWKRLRLVDYNAHFLCIEFIEKMFFKVRYW